MTVPIIPIWSAVVRSMPAFWLSRNDLPGDVVEDLGIDPESGGTGEGFAADFQEDASIMGFRGHRVHSRRLVAQECSVLAASKGTEDRPDGTGSRIARRTPEPLEGRVGVAEEGAQNPGELEPYESEQKDPPYCR